MITYNMLTQNYYFCQLFESIFKIVYSFLIMIQISGRTSETLERGFELLAEDLNIRPMVRVWI